MQFVSLQIYHGLLCREKRCDGKKRTEAEQEDTFGRRVWVQVVVPQALRKDVLCVMPSFGRHMLNTYIQGGNFESHQFTEMRKLLGNKKMRTTGYHPQSYSMLQRFSRTKGTGTLVYAARHPQS